MSDRYVIGDSKGWLNVRYTADDSTYPPLPNYLRVNYHGTENNRDAFTILEGKPKGKQATVRRKEDGTSYLQEGSPWLPPARVVYARKSGQLWYGTSGPIEVVTDETNPQPYGTYDLEIPDEVHALGEHYEGQSIFAKTWFRVGHNGDRYLHPGSISAGCTTVTDVSAWTSIYQYLVRRRTGDNASVGTLRVIRFAWERNVPAMISDILGRVFKS